MSARPVLSGREVVGVSEMFGWEVLHQYQKYPAYRLVLAGASSSPPEYHIDARQDEVKLRPRELAPLVLEDQPEPRAAAQRFQPTASSIGAAIVHADLVVQPLQLLGLVVVADVKLAIGATGDDAERVFRHR